MSAPEYYFVEDEKRRLLTIRWFIFSAFIGIAIAGFFYGRIPGTIDPWIPRITVSLLAAYVLAASFISKAVRKNIDIYIYFWFYVSMMWTLWLLVINHFSGAYVIGVFTNMTTYGVLVLRKPLLATVFLLLLSLFSVVASVMVTNPQTDPMTFAFMISLNALIVGLISRARRLAEQTSAQRGQAFRTIFNESADALFLAENDTRKITDCNQRAITLFDAKDKEEFIGVAGEKILQSGLTPQELADANTQLEQKHMWEKEGKFTTIHGKTFWGNIVIQRIDLNGRSVSLVRISDVSARKENEEALQVKSEELRVKAEELEKMNEMMVGRELKMAELKKENDQLKTENSSAS
jgi:PAS domain S-box-containing protein